MKTDFIALCALALSFVAASSCNKTDVEVVEPQGQEVKFKVLTEETKTYLKDGVTNWSNDDYIYVLDQSGKWYNSSKLESGTVVEAEFTFPTFPADPTYALFVGANNSATLGIEEGKVTANLISEQSISNNNSFGKSANLTIGEVVKVDGTTYGATLKNVCGLLKFEVPAGIASVKISGNDNEDLAGVVYIDYNAGEPTWTAKDGVKEVTVTPRKSGESYSAGTYYACVLPQTFEKGITVTLTYADGTTESKVGSSSLVLERNGVIDLSKLTRKIVEFDFTVAETYPEEFPTSKGIQTSPVLFKASNGEEYSFSFTKTDIWYRNLETDSGKALIIPTSGTYLTLPVIEGKSLLKVTIGCGNTSAKKFTLTSSTESTDSIDDLKQLSIKAAETGGTATGSWDITSSESSYHIYCANGTNYLRSLTLTYE